MAKTALTQLQDQIEAIRREAYQAGYAAAMQAIRDFAARPSGMAIAKTANRPALRTNAAPAKPVGRRARSAKAAPAPRRTGGGRPQRGTNARLIVDVLKGLPSSTGRPADIRKALQSGKGVVMAFTSIRHALGQLEARRVVEQIADSKSWRHMG